jgi:acetylornithine deacetylase/succinyl-diaminopimelate desuccinylase-like protein
MGCKTCPRPAPSAEVVLMKIIRHLLLGTALLAVIQNGLIAETEHADIKAEITKRHDEAVKRLQDWIAQVSIAAEDRGYPEGAEYMAKLARDAGFQQATVINTDGKPGVFATLDAGAPKTVGLYFMYDVKQFDPSEWSSPPTEARIVGKPPLGEVMIGRGAVNRKGPEAAFLAALLASRGAGKKMPVNLVMVAEGEEEIGSPHIPQLVRRPEVLDALSKCVGVFLPHVTQDLDGFRRCGNVICRIPLRVGEVKMG